MPTAETRRPEPPRLRISMTRPFELDAVEDECSCRCYDYLPPEGGHAQARWAFGMVPSCHIHFNRRKCMARQSEVAAATGPTGNKHDQGADGTRLAGELRCH